MQHEWRRLAVGIVIAALGLICLGSGIALLAWRLIEPDKAVLLPPGTFSAPESTPTPGILGTPLAPPPLPDDPGTLVILPVSQPEQPTLTIPPSATPRPTQTFTLTALPTLRPTRPAVQSVTPARPTASATLPAPPTVSQTPAPTATPSPTLTPTAQPAAPDRIIIRAIGLDAPIVPVGQHALSLSGQLYSQWDVPGQKAAGWHQSSARLGQPGNTVLNGHHNTHGEVFRDLVALKPGSLITLQAGSQRYMYGVVQSLTLVEENQPVTVRQENARWILPTADERVTLITCWPYTANTHRLIVVALPVAVLRQSVELP